MSRPRRRNVTPAAAECHPRGGGMSRPRRRNVTPAAAECQMSGGVGGRPPDFDGVSAATYGGLASGVRLPCLSPRKDLMSHSQGWTYRLVGLVGIGAAALGCGGVTAAAPDAGNDAPAEAGPPTTGRGWPHGPA